jgi:hypothetical protein
VDNSAAVNLCITMMAAPVLAWLYPPERLRAERNAEEAAGDATSRVLVSVALAASGPRLLDLANVPASTPVVTFDHIPFFTAVETINGYMVQVKGYASATGSAALNQKLSEDRANNVANLLLQKGRIPLTNMLAPGAMGESRQISGTDKTADTEAENRRVVVRRPGYVGRTRHARALTGGKYNPEHVRISALLLRSVG